MVVRFPCRAADVSVIEVGGMRDTRHSREYEISVAEMHGVEHVLARRPPDHCIETPHSPESLAMPHGLALTDNHLHSIA